MKLIVLKSIKLYQKKLSFIISRLRPNCGCRFYPTCSEYCCQAIKKYGTIKGLFAGFKRILRCNPFNNGGIDLC